MSDRGLWAIVALAALGPIGATLNLALVKKRVRDEEVRNG